MYVPVFNQWQIVMLMELTVEDKKEKNKMVASTHWIIFYCKIIILESWRDGSVIKKVYYSDRRPKFSFQEPHCVYKNGQ